MVKCRLLNNIPEITENTPFFLPLPLTHKALMLTVEGSLCIYRHLYGYFQDYKCLSVLPIDVMLQFFQYRYLYPFETVDDR